MPDVAGTVWVDFSTAPDPMFFRPITRRLEDLGYGVWATAREYGATTGVADACGFSVDVVGRHGGQGTVRKAVAIADRAVALTQLARRRRPDIALSFNSYAQAIAARAAGIPFVTVADYEYQPANHLAFRLAHKVIVPEAFDRTMLRRQGARPDRVVRFPGLKEHVALVGFSPDPAFPERLRALGVEGDRIVVTMRPPATSSLYHRFANDWFYEVVSHVASHADVAVVALPRYPSQEDRIRALELSNVVVPAEVLDGLNLVYWSDLVIGAGGSMNREAAVLGTPAYTVFAGRMAGVDERLIAEGALVVLRSPADFARLRIAKKPPRPPGPSDDSSIRSVVDAILDARRRRRSH